MAERLVEGKTLNIAPSSQQEEQIRERRKHNPQRLEDLSPEEGNTPSGRGSDTASSRGYDTEKLVSRIFEGTTDNREPWYDVKTTYTLPERDVEIPHLIECKSCIDQHPNGEKGTFRIWKKHHDRLLESGYRATEERKLVSYVFLVYTIVDSEAIEIGKFKSGAYHIEELIDEWNFVKHETMGYEFCKDISWTKLIEELGISLGRLHRVKPYICDPDPKATPGSIETVRELKKRFDY